MKTVNKKVVIVGDGACGKTCFLEVFKSKTFPDMYVPTVVDNFARSFKVSEKLTQSITFWDTAGQEEFEGIRRLSYKNCDAVIICYSVDSKAFISNIKLQWAVEVENFAPENTMLYVVGLKKDLRDDLKKTLSVGSYDEVIDEEDLLKDFVSVAEGKEIAGDLKAVKFFECSAYKNEGVDTIFSSISQDLASMDSGQDENASTTKKCCGLC